MDLTNEQIKEQQLSKPIQLSDKGLVREITVAGYPVVFQWERCKANVIHEEHVQELINHAQSVIEEKIEEGFVEGIIDKWFVRNEEAEDWVVYTGFWRIQL